MIKALLLLLNAAKLGPLLKMGGTMILSVGAYALIFGWWYAVGFVALLLVHELGHYMAARRIGLPAGLPMFIPFVGAWIELKEQPMSVSQEAYVAFAGPFVGTIGATIVLWLAGQYESNLLMALAYAGFFINLFNLIPMTPFDGGRIVAILSPKLWFLGVPILLIAFFYLRSPMLLIILILLAPTMWHALKGAWEGKTPEDRPRYYDVPQEARIRYAAYYLLLIVYLCAMTYQVHERLSSSLGS